MSPLPPTLISVTSDWLDSVDRALDEILAATSDIDAAMASRVALAVGGVREHTSRFRQVMRREVAVDQRADSDWVPLRTIDRTLAERIHGNVIQATSLSASVHDTAHAALPDPVQRKAFLLHVGDVAGTAFVNLARQLWEDHPDLAPEGWNEGNGPMSS